MMTNQGIINKTCMSFKVPNKKANTILLQELRKRKLINKHNNGAYIEVFFENDKFLKLHYGVRLLSSYRNTQRLKVLPPEQVQPLVTSFSFGLDIIVQEFGEYVHVQRI